MQTLVTQGRRATGLFDSRPVRVNPLDAFTGPRRALQRLRLKEWVGWTFMHPELSASMILQDANYLASSEIYVRDAASQARQVGFPHAVGPTKPAVGIKVVA